MLARRVIVVGADKAFVKQLTVALKAAGGAVDAHEAVDALGAQADAALVVIHLDGALSASAPDLLQRLIGETRVIAILPRANLAAVVDIMQASDRVAGMLVAEDLDATNLSAMATRVIAGDIFGLEKTILWGTVVHSFLVGDYQEKSLCIAQVSEFAENMGVRRKYRESIEQCLDEMLMNALYDAPVDEQGNPLFTEIPIKNRISLRVEQKAVVQYACDGKQFIIAVRDAFGSLDRQTVLRYLHKCLTQENQIDRKAGGAGLGLYLMASSSSSMMFNVLPGVATEAVCRFDLETPKPQLESFGFFTERIDAAGRLASGPSRRLSGSDHPVPPHPVERRTSHRASPGPSKGLIAALLFAIIATIGLAVAVAWPRLSGVKRTQVTVRTIPPGATVEVEGKNAGTANTGALVVRELEVGRAYPVVARLDGYEPRQAVVQPRNGDNEITLELRALAPTIRIESNPSGASVEINGAAAGTTPLSVSTLAPGSAVELAFKKNGYQTVTTKLDVPSAGKETRLIQPLSVSDELAKVRLTSEPPGAQIVQNGQVLAGVTTPAEVIIEAGKVVRFTLTMTGKVPFTIEPFTPGRGASGLVRNAVLVDGAALNVASNYDGKVSIKGQPQCQDMALPASCVLAAGSHTLELVATRDKATSAKLTRRVNVTAKGTDEKFELGIVEAPPNKLVELNGAKGRRVVVEAGARKVKVMGTPGHEEPPHEVAVTVKAGATVVAN